MNAAEATRAARDAITRARDADEQLRTALGEATVWLALALDPSNGSNDREDDPS